MTQAEKKLKKALADACAIREIRRRIAGGIFITCFFLQFGIAVAVKGTMLLDVVPLSVAALMLFILLLDIRRLVLRLRTISHSMELIRSNGETVQAADELDSAEIIPVHDYPRRTTKLMLTENMFCSGYTGEVLRFRDAVRCSYQPDDEVGYLIVYVSEREEPYSFLINADNCEYIVKQIMDRIEHIKNNRL